MVDKAVDKAADKADKAPVVKTDKERDAEIATEYEALLTQSQDEDSIVKALCSKYSLEKDALTEIVAKAREAQGQPARPGTAPAHPAKEGQMGEAPPKGTVQSGKAPEGRK
jgi:hypothetical protein